MMVVGIENSARCFCPKKERSTVRLLASTRPVQAMSGPSDVEASIEPMEAQAQVTGGLHSSLVRHSGRWGAVGTLIAILLCFWEIGVSPVFHILTHFYR